MMDGEIDAAARVAAEEYISGRLKSEIVTAIRKRVDITQEQAWLMVEAIDAHEDQKEQS